HYDNYWREVNETKTRDRVVARLKELGAPQAELDLIEEAKKNSDALIATEEAAMKAVAEGDFDRARQLMFDENYDKNKAVITAPLKKFQDMMNARAEREARDAAAGASLFLDVINGLLALTAAVMLGALFYLIVLRIVRPVRRMTAAMNALAAGDTEVAVPEVGRRDEIGEMAKAVQVFKENA